MSDLILVLPQNSHEHYDSQTGTGDRA